MVHPILTALFDQQQQTNKNGLFCLPLKIHVNTKGGTNTGQTFYVQYRSSLYLYHCRTGLTRYSLTI